MKTQRLRSRVALAFALLSLMVALIVAIGGYTLVQTFLVEDREQASLTRAQADAEAIDRANVTAPADRLTAVATGDGVQKLLLVNERWYATGVTVSPDEIPTSLIEVAAQEGNAGALQRFAVGGVTYVGVALPTSDGTFVELSPLTEVSDTLDQLRLAFVFILPLAIALGAALGWWTAGRVLRPLRRLATTADALAAGSLDERMGPTGDPDLDPISAAFDDMAEAVQARISRERRFVANVSHELRTPITSALGTIEILDQRELNLPEADARLLTLLSDQVTRLAHMVLDLLELGTVTPDTKPQTEIVDFAGVIRTVLLHRGIAPEVLRVVVEPRVESDPRRLERIVANLIDNAERHGEGVVRVTVDSADGMALCLVDDAGPGVKREERESIFELFNRGSTTSPGTGAGLGLSLVREQADLLGATVHVTDSPEGGARFTVSLPMFDEVSETASERVPAPNDAERDEVTQ